MNWEDVSEKHRHFLTQSYTEYEDVFFEEGRAQRIALRFGFGSSRLLTGFRLDIEVGTYRKLFRRRHSTRVKRSVESPHVRREFDWRDRLVIWLCPLWGCPREEQPFKTKKNAVRGVGLSAHSHAAVAGLDSMNHVEYITVTCCPKVNFQALLHGLSAAIPHPGVEVLKYPSFRRIT